MDLLSLVRNHYIDDLNTLYFMAVNWSYVMHMCVIKSGCHLSGPSHYLNQCWVIFNGTIKNKVRLKSFCAKPLSELRRSLIDFYSKYNNLIYENYLENIAVYDMADILSQSVRGSNEQKGTASFMRLTHVPPKLHWEITNVSIPFGKRRISVIMEAWGK